MEGQLKTGSRRAPRGNKTNCKGFNEYQMNNNAIMSGHVVVGSMETPGRNRENGKREEKDTMQMEVLKQSAIRLGRISRANLRNPRGANTNQIGIGKTRKTIPSWNIQGMDA